jgi:general nucleoside transport system ATP-binding protein
VLNQVGEAEPTPLQAIPNTPAAIELTGINKRFGAVHANRDVNLSVARASIHGIVGENGAGKSTLMSILYGFYEADSGEIAISGKPVRIDSSRRAIAHGIGMVHQHFMLVDTLSVVENVMLGAEGGFFLGKAARSIETKLAELATLYGLQVDPHAIVGDLAVGLQQRVEILKALVRGAEILILDEPTAVLTPAEADQLFHMLRVLKREGKTVIFITHKLREIMAITDRVSVMRRGEVIETVDTDKTTVGSLANAMVGRPVLLKIEKIKVPTRGILLEVRNLVVKDDRGIVRVADISFDVRAGEVVGIAGVSGNGQSELLEVLAGIRKPASGTVVLAGRKVTHFNPAELRKAGLAHVPEDRQSMGLVLSFEENENAILGYHDDEQFRWCGPLLRLANIRAQAMNNIATYNIQPPDCRLKTANFSGGNQQKIVLAREIEHDPKVLLVGQPTRGVDIGAIEFIHKRLIALRDQGKAILLVSVELDEIMALSDRIVVMCGGRITGERTPETTDTQDLGLLMAGLAGNPS